MGWVHPTHQTRCWYPSWFHMESISIFDKWWKEPGLKTYLKRLWISQASWSHSLLKMQRCFLPKRMFPLNSEKWNFYNKNIQLGLYPMVNLRDIRHCFFPLYLYCDRTHIYHCVRLHTTGWSVYWRKITTMRMLVNTPISSHDFIYIYIIYMSMHIYLYMCVCVLVVRTFRILSLSNFQLYHTE